MNKAYFAVRVSIAFKRGQVIGMTSEERHELRYQRRKAARLKKRRELHPGADNYYAVFTFKNLWKSYRNCRKNVAWKGSVQRYIFSAPIRVQRTHRKLMQFKYKCVVPHEWDTYERGKPRHIKSVPIGERVVQRCLADNSLVPVLGKTFIYDNGACMKDKGYTFAINRLEKHLHQYYRKHGSEGYILLYDFSKFYENVDHDLIRFILRKLFSDPRNLGMVDNILATFGKGLGLGSQISQILALASANALDHQAKEVMKIEGYARYNDDGYMIHPSKKYLQKCLRYMKRICDILHIKLNEKKTQIVKLTHGFKFLKARVYLTATGKVIKKVGKRNIVRERRKLKKLRKKLDEGLVDWKHIKMQYQSWRSWTSNFNAFWTIQSMDKLYYQIYHDQLKMEKEAVA